MTTSHAGGPDRVPGRATDRVRDRRQFLGMSVASVALSLLSADSVSAKTPPKSIKAVAFDGFALFDPRPVFELAEELFPGRGAALSNAWRTRQFEYTWLRNSMGRYVDFWRVTQDALHYAAALTQVALDASQGRRLMGAYLELKPWTDVPSALELLRKQNFRLAILSNLTPMMMRSCVKASGLEDVFDFQLSTDQVQAFKPDPRSYNMGLDAFHLSREEIAFVPSAGWDAVGAKTFGHPTYWVNRLNVPAEELGVTADATVKDLTELPRFLAAWKKEP